MSLLLFFFGKLFFLLVNTQNWKADLMDFPSIWWAGLRLDLSFTSYLALLPVLLLVFYVKPSWFNTFTKYYMGLCFAVILLILSLDPFFYDYWGMKFNFLFTQYLGDLKAGSASIQSSDYLLGFTFLVLSGLAFYLLPKNWKQGQMKRGWFNVIPLALIVLLGRGGWGRTPIGISSAYGFANPLFNNTAVNSAWNLVAYEFGPKHEQLNLLPSDEVYQLLHDINDSASEDLFRLSLNDSSRVILVVMESFSAKMSSFFSGKPRGYTPHLDALAEEGIAFTRAYAGSFRSDRGLTALLTGMPSLATVSLTDFPNKLEKWPNLYRSFDSAGWNTSFHYGGDLEFANVRTLANHAGFIREKKDFDTGETNAWGFHDEWVFREFARDIERMNAPAFHLLFSISSHEPFDVPHYRKYELPYGNSMAYADSCLGDLIATLKAKDLWKNSLVILTADHGSTHPDGAVGYHSTNYHVPLIFSGGLVPEAQQITEVVSHFDLPRTLLEMAQLEADFPFSQHLARPVGIAFYNYYNGICYVRDSCTQCYDIPLGNYMEGSCGPPCEQAFFQRADRMFHAP